MAVQTYIKRGNAYTAALNFSGSDADVILGDYQVFITLIHEWGDPVWEFSNLNGKVTEGDTLVVVHDGTQFSVGDSIVFLDGRSESVVVSAIDSNTLTVNPIRYSHNPLTKVAVERLATRASANNYTYDLTSTDVDAAGKHRIRWRYVVLGTSTVVDRFVTVYQQYIDDGTFFDIYPDLETDWGDLFDDAERIVRGKINTICGQSFDYFPSKALIVDGSGRNTLRVPLRLERFNTVRLKDDYSDITEVVEYDPYSKWYLRLSSFTSTPISGTSSSKPKWGDQSQFEVLGDWGWQFVPENITQAASLLLADAFNEDSTYFRHGIIGASMDTQSFKFDPAILGTSGNIEAEILLMDYCLFSIAEI